MKSIYEMAVENYTCERCDADVGEECITVDDREMVRPHRERVAKLTPEERESCKKSKSPAFAKEGSRSVEDDRNAVISAEAKRQMSRNQAAAKRAVGDVGADAIRAMVTPKRDCGAEFHTDVDATCRLHESCSTCPLRLSNNPKSKRNQMARVAKILGATEVPAPGTVKEVCYGKEHSDGGTACRTCKFKPQCDATWKEKREKLAAKRVDPFTGYMHFTTPGLRDSQEDRIEVLERKVAELERSLTALRKELGE